MNALPWSLDAPERYDFRAVWNVKDEHDEVVLPSGRYRLLLEWLKFVHPHEGLPFGALLPRWRVLDGTYTGRRAQTCMWVPSNPDPAKRFESARRFQEKLAQLGVTRETYSSLTSLADVPALVEGLTVNVDVVEHDDTVFKKSTNEVIRMEVAK